MIQNETVMTVADNSGARKAMCIKVLGGSHRRYATVGDKIVVAIKEAIPRGKVQKGTVQRAIIVRTKFPVKRPDGSIIRFDDNAVVLINKNNFEPIGTRILDRLRVKFVANMMFRKSYLWHQKLYNTGMQ